MQNILIFTILFVVGCVGSPIHSTLTYNDIQTKIKNNNKRLLSLKINMKKDQVLSLMGEPERY